MLKYFAALKSRFEAKLPDNGRGLREFAAAMILLALALCSALLSKSATGRGDHAKGILFALAALVPALIIACTVVPRLVRKANPGRWLPPMPFSITRQGGIYILIIFLLSLAAINSGNNLLFLVLAMLLSAIVISGIAARGSLKSVAVSLQVPENVFAGERLCVKVSVQNRKRCFPSCSLSIENWDLSRHHSGLLKRLAFWSNHAKGGDADPGRSVLRHSAYFPVILPGETRSELVSQLFPARGAYHLEGFRISTRFPFGFFKRSERVRAQGEVLVYPSTHELSRYFHLLPFLAGQIEGMRAGQGESLYVIRKYQERDSARRVAWKATAKTGELMSREFARDEESKFCLILDTLIHTDAATERFERAVSLAATLAAHLFSQGAELEFLTPREHVTSGIGSDHLYRILRSLALVAWESAPRNASPDLRGELSEILEERQLRQILSDKLFKIIISSKPRGSFASDHWRSSQVVYFDEL